MDAQIDWVRPSRAAELLGCSTDTVHRKARAGQLESTSDPSIIEAATGRRRGRRPSRLVSVRGISELRVKEGLDQPPGGQVDGDCRERLVVAEAERVRLHAEVERWKEVVRLSLVRDGLHAQADAARRDQLSQFLVPDFPND